ncbi:MAG TPA: hypothetical protein VIY73_17460 [Polyangiaceae bacterium]
MTSPPVWLVALLCAVLAPWAARALQAYFERRARQRTTAFLDAVRQRTPPSERRCRSSVATHVDTDTKTDTDTGADAAQRDTREPRRPA